MNKIKRKIDITSLSLIVIAIITMIIIQAITTVADAVLLIITYAFIMVLVLLSIMLQIKGYMMFRNEVKNEKDKELLNTVMEENKKKVKNITKNNKNKRA